MTASSNTKTKQNKHPTRRREDENKREREKTMPPVSDHDAPNVVACFVVFVVEICPSPSHPPSTPSKTRRAPCHIFPRQKKKKPMHPMHPMPSHAIHPSIHTHIHTSSLAAAVALLCFALPHHTPKGSLSPAQRSVPVPRQRRGGRKKEKKKIKQQEGTAKEAFQRIQTQADKQTIITSKQPQQPPSSCRWPSACHHWQPQQQQQYS